MGLILLSGGFRFVVLSLIFYSMRYIWMFGLLLGIIYGYVDNVGYRVLDGDTLGDIYGNRYRLLYVDCPEKDQAYGISARDFVDSLVVNGVVELRVDGIDRYGRRLSILYVDGIEVNGMLVSMGLAWSYRYNSRYLDKVNQANAMDRGLGLWCCEPVEPYLWRKGVR